MASRCLRCWPSPLPVQTCSRAVTVSYTHLDVYKRQVLVGGVMEHIEEAGVHSGDSSCSLPPYSLSDKTQAELRRQVVELAKALNVVGLMNTQFAIQTNDSGDDTIYLLEVNPRASRTVPFVSLSLIHI